VRPAPESGLPGGAADQEALEQFAALMARHRPLAVLTGAGCSVGSGIPAYRDHNGDWAHPQPVQYASFIAQPAVRQRYWARATTGWRRIGRARPNAAHRALARLQTGGLLSHIITQNVDGLHQAAGSRNVIDLHGRLDQVCCLGCGARQSRAALQLELEARNPGWSLHGTPAPDGDAQPLQDDCAGFRVPACERCGGILKPDVVFFGEAIPAGRVKRAMDVATSAAALLVVGSSLMVFSGFRFAREAARLGQPVLAVNLGKTRADDLLSSKLGTDCAVALPALARLLTT
jgi:NAD-dependent SIR2 family protein deacetylase